MAPPRFQLLFLDRSVALSPEGVTVGRAADCEVRIESDRCVSRHHARFREVTAGSNASVEVEDLGSVNGTLVNERPVQGKAAVGPGDRITIGAHVFRIGDELDMHRTARPRSIRPASAPLCARTDLDEPTLARDPRLLLDACNEQRRLGEIGALERHARDLATALLVRGTTASDEVASSATDVWLELAGIRSSGEWAGYALDLAARRKKILSPEQSERMVRLLPNIADTPADSLRRYLDSVRPEAPEDQVPWQHLQIAARWHGA